MNILYDHQIFEHQRVGGVSRYFSEIINHLPQDVNADVSVGYTFNEYLKNLDVPFIWKEQLLTYNGFFPNFDFKGKKRLFHYIQKKFPSKYPDLLRMNKEETIQKLKAGNFDLFHPTFYDDYFLDYIADKPYVLTVHDMIIELYPEFINSPVFIKRKKKLVDNASHIIAVSENTKKDLIRVFDTAEHKISVTYHASSLDENGCKPENIPNKYLLYVGDRRLGYKNFSFFISAIQPILQRDRDLFVVCTGDSFTREELHFFKELNIESQIVRSFVDDKQMYGLYNSAKMFIYPSYYEGFGIPILEAFQSKCPVVLANSSCFPEVVGDAGLLFDSKSPHDLRNAIVSILENENLRDEMILKGQNRLKLFSWKKTAQQTADIYRQVLNQS